jgi:hypothetical protein
MSSPSAIALAPNENMDGLPERVLSADEREVAFERPQKVGA